MLKSETICAIDYLFGLKLLIDELMLKPGTTALLTMYSALIYWLMNWCWNQALTALSTTYSVLMIDWLIYVKTSNYLRYRLIFGLYIIYLLIDWCWKQELSELSTTYLDLIDWLMNWCRNQAPSALSTTYSAFIDWLIDWCWNQELSVLSTMYSVSWEAAKLHQISHSSI